MGNYEIVRMLARGGMAVVYLVRQPALDREVVLKRLDLESDDPALAQRFVREARLAATLDHPNVVTLFDFFEHDGVPYIAMEYVAGGSLRELVGQLDLPQICGVVEGVLAGLGHAERRGIAHRDLKPENVLLTSRGNVKIADFGIARAYNALTQRLTAPGMAIGTPAYMAPEQATNDPLGPYTDLYALGVITYELLSGRPPFLSDTPVGLLYAHVHQRPPPLEELVEPGHVAVCGWVQWLLAKDPAARPQSAAEAWDALEEVAVAEMGPYWRRTATITAPVPSAAEAPPANAEPPTTEEGGEPPADEEQTHKLPTPDAARPRALGRAAPSAPPCGVAGGGVGARRRGRGGGVRGADHDPPTPAAAGPIRPSSSATPYDFDGDHRQELVIALLRASPRGRSARGGVVLIHDSPGRKAAWQVVTESRAGLPGRPREGDDFGSGLASGDFDRDGYADLAIGTPGRERVSVLYGTSKGVDDERTEQLRGRARGPARGRRPLRLRARGGGPRRRRLRRSRDRRPGRARRAAVERRGPRRLRRQRRAAPRPQARHPSPGRGHGQLRRAPARRRHRRRQAARPRGGRPGAQRRAGARELVPQRRARARALPRAAVRREHLRPRPRRRQRRQPRGHRAGRLQARRPVGRARR